jgi:hypothetical protein
MQRKWHRTGALPQEPRYANQQGRLSYSDANNNELCLYGYGDEITITCKYVGNEVYQSLKDLNGVGVSQGPLLKTTLNSASRYEQFYTLFFGPSKNQADAINFLTSIDRHLSLTDIIGELKAFCWNTKITSANSENVDELKEKIAAQAKQIDELQREISRLREGAMSAAITTRVRMF